MENDAFFKNTVSAKGQLRDGDNIRYNLQRDSKLKVLFVGNSITLHGVCESIGWNHECGMAASRAENDYVHPVINDLRKRY